jgi:hypothetical protein
VAAADVIALADTLYALHEITAADAHTLQLTVTRGVSYVPIPAGTGQNIAGLFTVDLPPTVRTGQEFTIVVQRVATRATREPDAAAAPDAVSAGLTWRYVVGTFQVTIPVETRHTMLVPEENTLAILKWRLTLTQATSRWYPVLLRYIEYVSGRVNALGGNAGAVGPSPNGYLPPVFAGHHNGHRAVGKVVGLAFDRFGDFDGFRLLTEEGHRRSYHSREREVESLVRFAWLDRIVVEVTADAHQPEAPEEIILLRAPSDRAR